MADGGRGRDPGHLERGDPRPAPAEQRPAWQVRRQAGRVRGVDDVDGVGVVGDPQADPQADVRSDGRVEHAGRALRGQDEVDAQRSSRCARSSNPVRNSGRSAASVANSSTTTTRDGGAPPVARRR